MRYVKSHAHPLLFFVVSFFGLADTGSAVTAAVEYALI